MDELLARQALLAVLMMVPAALIGALATVVYNRRLQLPGRPGKHK